MRRQRGFTLIELMVALVVSSLLVGMILAIFSRMSLAYRGQQQIAGVQQVLAAARATIAFDAKQAGLEMAQGFTTALTGATPQPPVQIKNSNTGPDQVAFFYADPSTQAAVQSSAGWPAAAVLTVDANAGFAPLDLVAVTSTDVTTSSPTRPGVDANVAKYATCIVQVAAISPSGPPYTISFSTSGSWGAAGLPHCQALTPGAMVYKFVARAYRIDTTTPARAALGLLQLSTTGDLLGAAGTWNDLAYGFTDLQTALQVFEQTGTDNADPDSDPQRNWYSGALQNTEPSAVLALPNGLLQISISLVARTDRDIEGIATTATPALIDTTAPANLDFNTIGDHPSVNLLTTADPALQGSRIYRYTTFQVDFRNLGVGR